MEGEGSTGGWDEIQTGAAGRSSIGGSLLPIFQSGPCGGAGGGHFEFDMIGKLEKIRVFSGSTIDAISITCKVNGKVVNSPRWGGPGGNSTEITLDAGEVLTSINGFVGSFQGVEHLVRSLTFVTNLRSYGPYGVQQGIPFCLHAGLGGIVGFFGRSGYFLDSIGILVDNSFTKLYGSRGGPGGSPFGINIAGSNHQSPKLVKIRVYSGLTIDAISIVYKDGENVISSPRWGGSGGNINVINLGIEEVLTSISGFVGSYGGNTNVVRSLTFVTNLRSYGPYGTQQGVPFTSPTRIGSIVGFFGRSGVFLDSIGIVVHPIEPNMLIKHDGPCGGAGGNRFDMNITHSQIHKLVKIRVRSGRTIDAISIVYRVNGNEIESPRWGGAGGKTAEITLGSEEVLTSINGYVGPFGQLKLIVRSLTFVTNLRSYGPYGTQQGVPFTLPARLGSIVGFFGRSGVFLDNIGILVQPTNSNTVRQS